MRKHISFLLTSLGLLLAIGSIITVIIIDRPLVHGQPVMFVSLNDDVLVGTYYAGTQPNGVMLLEGFGSDQVTMTSLASEYAREGWHVFTFDFSGHGRSPGTLTFDNARTDRMAIQAFTALQDFKQVSGLRASQIVVIGHSLGARVALQSAAMNSERVAGLVLLGTQVNLSTNVQSEFFTGTTDADLPWVQSLGPENLPVPVVLISGDWDDILTPVNAEKLFNKLGGENSSVGRVLLILPGLVHNYEPFSPRVISEITDRSNVGALRIWTWVLGFAGLLLASIGGAQWAAAAQNIGDGKLAVGITNLRRFLWGKLWLWLGALPLAAILGGIFFFIPLGKPVFNLIYVGFIGGYGILLTTLYWRGKMPGVQGKLPFSKGDFPREWKRILTALGITAIMLLLTAAYARTGWFYVPPANLRFVWLVIFTPFTALGFWIGLYEARMLRSAGTRSGAQTALTLIGLFPFFLYTILMAAIGSLSGMIGGLQGLLILWLVLAFGNLVQAVGRRPWLTAVCMAVLLYWLILPQGVLFG
jgi:pimeloyl-ACP methyl ester carboxylesterase